MLRFIDFMIRFMTCLMVPLMVHSIVDCTPIRSGYGTRFIIHFMNATTCITFTSWNPASPAYPTHSLLLPRRGMIGRVHSMRRGHPPPQYKDIHANMDIGVSRLSGSGGIVSVEGS